MEYIELTCHTTSGVHTSELLMDALGDVGFDSFTENEDGTISAYIQSVLFTHELETRLKSSDFTSLLASFGIKKIADQNWNAIWESQYEPVLIDSICMVRAPFHEKVAGVEFDIVIMPKMSFGTAHHETTKQMIQYMLSLQLKGKSLLDMGSGTAVLAILARMKGAGPVSAIDNDEWAYNNALENVQSNNFPEIEVLLGDCALLNGKKYDVIFANINRNILLNDIPAYRQSLNEGGKLFVSGFYSEDLPIIESKANEVGLTFMSNRVENNWIAACFTL
ncbi:MAG: 50S ribosomal protein L11 methyltransferase [Bacteroidales bacterium]